ncbi:MAG TPA: zeta toxin family protein [Puia sp.]|nr:zeta toxin family protein [Puia sp.]
MPVLYLLAGPNGSGKTTFYSIALQSNFIEPNLPFINVDIIVQSLGKYNEENYVRASEIYRETVKQYLDADADFMIESNLADSRSYEWVSSIKKKGYDVILYYLSTDDVAINIGRVQRRVAEGGHDIPEEIIKSRYKQSHSYLKTKLTLFKEVYLIDNTTDSSQIQIKLVDGIITERAGNLQDWINDVISIIERLKGK